MTHLLSIEFQDFDFLSTLLLLNILIFSFINLLECLVKTVFKTDTQP